MRNILLYSVYESSKVFEFLAFTSDREGLQKFIQRKRLAMFYFQVFAKNSNTGGKFSIVHSLRLGTEKGQRKF